MCGFSSRNAAVCTTCCTSSGATAVIAGRSLVLNGVDQVSPGLFGVDYCKIPEDQGFELSISSVRIIYPDVPKIIPLGGAYSPGGVHQVMNCLFDRYRPAHVLAEPTTWRQTSRTAGETWGKAVAAQGDQAIVEFWNEPYLNWNCKPGVNYDPRF